MGIKTPAVLPQHHQRREKGRALVALHEHMVLGDPQQKRDSEDQHVVFVLVGPQVHRPGAGAFEKPSISEEKRLARCGDKIAI